jgi:capsular polysaccharide export protein
MANILFLKGYKNLFPDVIKELEDEHTCYQFNFRIGEYIYNRKTMNSIFVPFKLPKKRYPISNEEINQLDIFQKDYNKHVKKMEMNNADYTLYKKYMQFVDDFVTNYNISLMVMYNGSSWTERLAAYIAEKRGIKTVYLELGYFRPFTISINPTGVNFNSSIPRYPEYYEEISMDEDRLAYMNKPINKDLDQLRPDGIKKVVISKLLNSAGDLMKVNFPIEVHHNLKELISIYKNKKKFKEMQEDDVDIPEKYIFVPFQVHSDTQILHHSPRIKTMELLVDSVMSAIEEFNAKYDENYHVIFKEHPEDIGRIDYSHLYKAYENKGALFLKKYNTDRLIEDAKVVITINSTVGIEALRKYKKVITLGNAFYNIEGIVNHCAELSDLPNNLETEITKERINENLINKFLYGLRFNHQTEGYVETSNKITSTNVAEEINKIIYS